MIGQTLDRYTIESKLGEGGMGVVYRARDTHLNRVVAIKVLPADKVADPDRRQRFILEARAASALNHRHIVTVHDIRADGGIDFIVMEHVGGRPLNDVIAGRPLRVDRALRYAIQIADAVACAHEAGIVHRDLKPSNILVTDDEVIKVLDFGLAKLVDPAERSAEAQTRTTPITDAGMIVGTAAYMSPEQAEGRKVDGRSDIFSFGAIVYEMVTGRRAFEGPSIVSVLAKILNDEPAAPNAAGAAIPVDVERAILRCLRKDPARRFQTMADLKVALQDLLDDSGKMPAATPPAGRSWLLSTGIATALVVMAAGGYAVWKKGTSPPAAELASKAVPLTTLAGVVRHPTFSADGNQVAFSWNGPKEDNTDIYVQQIGAGTPHRLTSDPGTDISPVWSPDGRAIAFLRILRDGRQELRLVPPVNGPERKVADIKPRGFLREVTLDWCRDSSCIIVTDHSAPDPGKPDVLFVVSVDSGEKRQLTSGPDTGLADTDPAVSPDGKWLVFRRDTAPFSGRLHVVPLSSGMTLAGEPRPITSFLLSAYWPRWISNDEILFSAKGALWRTRIAPGSEPARVAFAGEDGVTPAVSPAVAGRPARLAYVRSYRDTNVWRLETGGVGMPANGAPVRAIGSTRRDALAQLSPDGRSIVFISDRSGESELWISDVDGGNAVQLTSLGATPGFPRWSPDGSLVAFHSNTEEGPAGDVFVVPSGGGKPRKMTSDAASDTFATFSRDGRWIYFCSRREGSNAIWKLPVTGGAPTRVTPKTAIFALEGTDGKNIYFVEGSTLAVAGALWRQPLGQGAPEKLVDGVMPLAFDVLDRGIYYLGDVAGGSVLFYDFATRQSIVVAKSVAASNASASLSVSADGRTILFTRIDTRVDDLMLVDKFR